jgi:Tfp pilus assembly protein PilF
MSVSLLAAIALAPTAPLAVGVVQETAQVDVAYESLAAGNPHEAIARIESNRQLDSGEPAALINAGAAYARLGRIEEARKSFKAAMGSRRHYYLELADGRWMDSREAAQKAMARLETRLEIARR